MKRGDELEAEVTGELDLLSFVGVEARLQGALKSHQPILGGDGDLRRNACVRDHHLIHAASEYLQRVCNQGIAAVEKRPPHLNRAALVVLAYSDADQRGRDTAEGEPHPVGAQARGLLDNTYRAKIADTRERIAVEDQITDAVPNPDRPGVEGEMHQNARPKRARL